VGEGFNEDLLQNMANAGGGGFYFIQTPDDAPALFAEELRELLSVVAQNLTITLTLSSEVTLVSQLNAYPMTTHDHQVEFLLHDLFGDELKTLLLELHIPALESLGPCQIGSLRFDYDELQENSAEHRTIELPIVVNVVPAEALPATAGPHPDVTRSVLLLKSAQAKEEAVRQADAGDFEAASQTLAGTAQLIEDSGLEDEDLKEEERELSQRSKALKDREQYDETMRKQMKFYSHATRTGRMGTSQLMREKHMDLDDQRSGGKPGGGGSSQDNQA
jgi:Ca-activated chloride channel family protein